jgi:chromosomal replication initiation ATPase DnaA
MITKATLYTRTKQPNPLIYLGLLTHENIKYENGIHAEARKLSHIKTSPTVDIIKMLLPKYYGCKFKEINVKTRVRPISDIKHHFIALVKETTDLSLVSIGAIFNYKGKGIDHTTVLNSIKAWDNLISYDNERYDLHKRFKEDIRERQLMSYLD